MLPYGSRASVPARPRRAPPPPPPRVNQMPPRPQAKQGFFFATDQDSSNAVTSPLAERVCAECALHFEDLFLCNACNCVFCDRCWDRQAAHRAQRRMAGGIRHEKTDLQLAHVMDGVFSQPTDEDVYRQMFLDDISASWFGVKKDGGRLIFLDHGRYGEVMAKTNIDRSESTFCSEFSVVNATQDLRTPSLVSLVGQTGAGKSTLIKLLVDLQHQNKTQNFGAPVVGMPGKDVPTSEGVHLYLDPGSALSDAPLLYADCEGLEGGEREPIGAKLGRREFNYEDEQCDAAFALRHRHASERELAWADSAFRRSREFIVTNLYPRLLYTFSDVIIFVLRNPRVIESVFEQLVIWAAAALETSSNQPALPHAIIVLNSCEYDSTNNTWDVATVTRELLQSLSDTIYLNPTFQKYIQYWQDRNKDIDTVEKLMMCYYSSLKVVRMPSKDRPQLMKRQTHELYNEIQTNCLFARNRKAELRMLLRAGELQSYLQFAFEHFSSRLDVPFDFVQASFLNSPIPSDFGGSILKLAIKMVEQEEDPDARVIFSKLSCMVASSIMLDSVRHKIKGNADSIFPLYIQHLDTALDDFCDRHWPCEFAINRASRTKPSRHSIDSQPGPTGITKCVNVRSGHGSKGHQLRDGRVFAAGDYVSDFSFEKNQTEFQNMVYFRLEHLLNLLAIRVNSGEAEDVAAAELHRDDVMAYFYNDGPRGGVRSVHSHSVCFCCLFEPPEHCLPCGHILCTACIRTYGRFKSANVIEMYECPLETNTAGRYRPWTIYLRPEAAGLRVLSLDSGGIRNIIQLELLRLIERQLNGKLPIQSFFDLMVGSGTGGVIALGLGTRNWSVEECIEHFENICAEAFSHRAGRHVPGVGWLVESISNAKYDNLPLDISLKKAFSDDQYLFGGPRHRGLSDLNVNVALATSTSAGNGVVLANYNRQQTGRARYQFYRSENLAAEFKTWEAARACMATPKLFKPLQHSLSKQSYLESSIHHQNPIHIAMNECKALRSVPYGVSEHPDIVLSLGSGLYAKTPNAIGPLTLHPLRTFSIRHRAVKIPEYRISMAAHCERVWDDCINSLSGSTPSSAFVRLNPEIPNGFADFESYDSMKILRRRITEQFYDDARIKKLAAQLVATLFYFESSNLTREAEAENFVVKGKILCRLPNETPEVREVGRFLKTRGNGHAHFLIAENPKAPQYFEISPSIVDNMIRFMEFNMDPICVHLSSKDSVLRASLLLEGWEQNSISGFPRSLASQEDGKAKRRTWGPRDARRSRFIQPRGRAWDRPDNDDYRASLDFVPLRDGGCSSTSSLNVNPIPPDSPTRIISDPQASLSGLYSTTHSMGPVSSEDTMPAGLRSTWRISELADTGTSLPRMAIRPSRPPPDTLSGESTLKREEIQSPIESDSSTSSLSQSIRHGDDSSISIQQSLASTAATTPLDITAPDSSSDLYDVEPSRTKPKHEALMGEIRERQRPSIYSGDNVKEYHATAAAQPSNTSYTAYSPVAMKRPSYQRHDSRMEVSTPNDVEDVNEVAPQTRRRPPPPPIPKKRQDLGTKVEERRRRRVELERYRGFSQGVYGLE